MKTHKQRKRERMSQAAVNRWRDPIARERIIAGMNRPEVKARQSALMKAAHARPEVKAKRSAAQKAANARPEVKAKRSASAKAANARPEVKAKRSAASKAANARPEVKAKRSAGQSRRWQEYRERKEQERAKS